MSGMLIHQKQFSGASPMNMKIFNSIYLVIYNIYLLPPKIKKKNNLQVI